MRIMKNLTIFQIQVYLIINQPVVKVNAELESMRPQITA